MSGLVDIWTDEVAKLREKGQAVFAGVSTGPANQESAHVDERRGGSHWWQTGLAAQALRVKKLPSLEWSEASVSMLVDIFSA